MPSVYNNRGHKRIGKTVTLKAIVLRAALENPGIEILLLSSTLKQSKSIHFRPLFTSNDPIFDKQYIDTINKTDLSVLLANGSRITCASCENIDALRGRTADIVIIDEAGHVALSDVMEVMQPVVSARNGDIIMIGTPSGKAHPFYQYVQRGILNSPFFTKGFRTWILPITDPTVVVPNKELRIQQAQSILSKSQFDQEYMASFDALEGRVYPDFDPILNESRKELCAIDPITKKNKALFISCDFNVSKMVACVSQEYIDPITKNREIHIIDEIVLFNTNTSKLADEINRRYSSTFKGRIYVCPDASGKSRKTSSSDTDHTILQKAGFVLLTDRANPLIHDRVNTVNAAISSANQTRRLYVHSRCKEIISSLQNQVYDPKTNKPEKGSGATDISAAPDAVGYLVMQRLPMTNINVKPTNALGY